MSVSPTSTRSARVCLNWLLRLPVLLAAVAAGAAEPADNLTPVTLNVGFVSASFQNVNRADAESAFGVLAKTVGRQRGYCVTTRTKIFETADEIEAAVKTGGVNVAIVDSWKYVSMNPAGYMTPCFVTSEQGQAAKKYLLLTRRDSGLNTPAALRGKTIVELEVANSNAGRAWLDTLLLENHWGAQTDFFGGVTFASKPALTVLPVFFSKMPACLVDQTSFELMSELNPQVGKELQAIAVSEPYVDNVVCLSTNGWPSEKNRQETIDILANLHKEPAGQQILTLFKVGPMVPFRNDQLETVRQLRARFERLQKDRQERAETGLNAQIPTADSR